MVKFIAIVLTTLAQAASVISVDFTQVDNGEITRDKKDRTYSVVIKNFKGFEKFITAGVSP